MFARRSVSTAIVAATVLLSTICVSAGEWITPDWPAGKEPSFRPVRLYWFNIQQAPLVYRIEISVPEAANRATALLRTSEWAYVCVDGRQVYAWAPRPKTNEQKAIPADPNRIHELELSPYLKPGGKHVLTVSAPAKGFVLDGGFYDGAKRLAPLATGGEWTVTKFAPTTILEDESIMKPGYSGPTGPVKAGDAWRADKDALATAYYKALVGRLVEDLDDAAWRLNLLADKGIYIIADTAYGWGGPMRIAKEAEKARVLLEKANALRADLEKLKSAPVTSEASLETVLAPAWQLSSDVKSLLADVQAVGESAMSDDKNAALRLALTTLKNPPDRPRMAVLREMIEKRIGHPLNYLNESRYDRLGWINHPGLADSDIGRWGIRVNPVTGPTKQRLPHRWRFQTDPNDRGIAEQRHTIGYNIENQWSRIDGQQPWTNNANFKNYKGIAWYRQWVTIPTEWAGNPVELRLRISGQGRLWLSDNEITEHGKTVGGRTVFTIPPDKVIFGVRNCLAIRVEATGASRGLSGVAEVACPALEGPEGRRTPPVAVLATPLSPCVVFKAKGDTIQIHHAGKAELLLPPDAEPADNYDAAKDGKLKAGWVFVWLTPSGKTDPVRPILMTFEKNPRGITCSQGVTTIRLSTAGERMVAVRPWAKAHPSEFRGKPALGETAAKWSRMSLAVPVNYMNVTRTIEPGESIEGISVDKVPQGPALGHTVIYDYLSIEDAWGAEPLKAAPVPGLCSYAIDRGFRTLKVDSAGEVKVLQDGGMLAPYRAVIDSDRISYSYRVEPYPRFAGFTSWMFSHADTGVVGNKREVELIAATGANSYRPQHNFSDHMPPASEWPADDRRPRLTIMADECNRVGLNYMNNIEQTLDRHKLCREQYDVWVRTVLFPHFEKVVPQVAGRPFWAAALDLVNEPFDHKAVKYNPTMKELTRRVRQTDKVHLLYIEPCQAWGAIQNLRLVEPTGDPLTVYSFHDYNFRLKNRTDRWPTADRDIRNIYIMWMPAFEFQVKHSVGMHCGEFGGFYDPSNDSQAQKLLMNDFFKIFDQFGMHHHYYSGRGIYERLADGSTRPSNVVRAYRDYFRRKDFNFYYKRWKGQPKPPAVE